MLYQLSYECGANLRKFDQLAKNYFEIFKALNSFNFLPFLTKNECFIIGSRSRAVPVPVLERSFLLDG
jgi:hypothetical protein